MGCVYFRYLQSNRCARESQGSGQVVVTAEEEVVDGSGEVGRGGGSPPARPAATKPPPPTTHTQLSPTSTEQGTHRRPYTHHIN
eukprot:scaffold13877_cov214-Alexandrium_tamarense.AAC.1